MLFRGRRRCGSCACRSNSSCVLPFGLGSALLRFARQAGELRVSGRGRFPVIELLKSSSLDFLTENTLNALDQRLVFPADEREGVSCLCRPTGPPDAVSVGIGRVGNVIVDNV